MTEKGFVPYRLIHRVVCPNVRGKYYLLTGESRNILKKRRGCSECSNGWCGRLKRLCSINGMLSHERFYDGVEMRPIKQ